MENAYQQVEALLQQMTAAMPETHEGKRLSEQISVLCRAHMAQDLNLEWIEAYKLTAQESRLVEFLAEKIGRPVAKGAALDAITFQHVEEPEIKIIDVLVCKIRKKLANSPYEIETVWGQGYRLKLREPQT